MAVLEIHDVPRISPPSRTMLETLRRAIRRYVWLDGLAAAFAWLGIAFWASLAIDWFFEPPQIVRVALLCATALVLAAIVARLIVSRILVPLADHSMAMLLERRFPQLEDSLLTSVLLADRRPEEAGYSAQMLARTCREADRRLAGLRLGDVLNPMPLSRKATVAACLAAIIAGFGLWLPSALGVWFQRSICMSDQLWPRKTRLEAVGFVDGVAKVAKGANFDLVVQAFDGDIPGPWPEEVELRYKNTDGPRKRQPMKVLGLGDVRPGAEAAAVRQQYGYPFRALLTDVDLSFKGGDFTSRNLKIQVVDPPSMSFQLEYHYPAYLEKQVALKPVTGDPVPMGTRLVICGTANKFLRKVDIDCLAGKTPLGERQRHLVARDANTGGKQVRLELQPLMEGATLLFSLDDTDGIKSREPIPLTLSVKPDDPPQVTMHLTGIGSAITPEARLPVLGYATDDYALGKIWFDGVVNQEPPVQVLLAALPKHPDRYDARKNDALEVSEFKLVRGQKLSLSIKAEDLCTLGGKGPNVGTTETWVLDVVSREDLLKLLTDKEMVLQQRFAAIVDEVADTRNLLLKMDFAPPPEKNTIDKKAAAKAKGKDKDKDVAKPGAEPGDQPTVPVDLPPAEVIARRAQHILQTLQNCRKNAQETLEVADAFDDIREQLTNNRIDTPELKHHIGAEIADPLHGIVNEMFPELERRLLLLEAAAADLQTGPERCNKAREQADDILQRMRTVLDHMTRMGDLGELVEKLRKLIKTQEEVERKTKERQNQDLEK